MFIQEIFNWMCTQRYMYIKYNTNNDYYSHYTYYFFFFFKKVLINKCKKLYKKKIQTELYLWQYFNVKLYDYT